jgi:hypothetical protein
VSIIHVTIGMHTIGSEIKLVRVSGGTSPPSRNVASRDPRLGTPHTYSCPTTRERTRDHRTSHASDTFDIFARL